MGQRIHNFNPGPAALPLPVLEKIQAELLDYKGTGMSVMEISHRSKEFDEIIDTAIERFKRLLNLGNQFRVLFMGGGASMQFAMVPMNLTNGRRPAYVNTGTWSTKAIKEAQAQNLDPLVVASSEDRNFTYIPTDFEAPHDAAYLHFTTNNTIKGTQWHDFPKCEAPLVADMSSDILSRPFDPSPFGCFYAGAQKNLGPAGVTVVVVREDMLDRVPKDLPTMLKYTTYAAKNSLANTAPTFPIYVVGLVLKWLEEDIGGLEKMDQINRAKAARLYRAMDDSGGFYRPTAEIEARSLMNVTFRLADENLEPVFVEEAAKAGLGGLKGHRSVGGCRASIYNACTDRAVDDLIDFMTDFAKKNG